MGTLSTHPSAYRQWFLSRYPPLYRAVCPAERRFVVYSRIIPILQIGLVRGDRHVAMLELLSHCSITDLFCARRSSSQTHHSHTQYYLLLSLLVSSHRLSCSPPWSPSCGCPRFFYNSPITRKSPSVDDTCRSPHTAMGAFSPAGRRPYIGTSSVWIDAVESRITLSPVLVSCNHERC